MKIEGKRVGREIVERLARFVESLPDDEENSIPADSATMDGAAREAERYAHGSDEIAQACAAAICDGHEIKAWRTISKHYATAISLTQTEVAERIAKTLDAIQQARQEGRSPTS